MERPIIMRDWEVRFVLDGRKTQTRRAVKPQPCWSSEYNCWLWDKMGRGMERPVDAVLEPPYGIPQGYWNLYSPFGVTGDRLWLREAWQRLTGIPEDHGVFYLADESDPTALPVSGHWRSPATMPRWASRLTLEVVRVWVERVQEIHHDDAIAEGVVPMCVCEDGCEVCIISPRTHFQDAWESLYHSWSANPWVWSCEFRRIET